MLYVQKREMCTYKTATAHLADLVLLCRYGDPEESLEVQEDLVTAAR